MLAAETDDVEPLKLHRVVPVKSYATLSRKPTADSGDGTAGDQELSVMRAGVLTVRLSGRMGTVAKVEAVNGVGGGE